MHTIKTVVIENQMDSEKNISSELKKMEGVNLIGTYNNEVSPLNYHQAQESDRN